MKSYTYSEIVEIMEERGANCADLVIGHMMDDVEDETGRFPSWDDLAPNWIIEACGV